MLNSPFFEKNKNLLTFGVCTVEEQDPLQVWVSVPSFYSEVLHGKLLDKGKKIIA